MTAFTRLRLRLRRAGKYGIILATLLTTGLPPTLAADPVIGAWRAVRNESGKRQFWFAMLPQAIPADTSFIAVDWKARKLVCCLVVQGKEISEDSLRNKLHIPGVWVTDLVNGWNSEHPPYRPRVFALTPSADFKAHTFAGAPPFAYGGLLLPEDSHLDAQGLLLIDEERYRARFVEEALGDGDGAVDTYTLTAVSGGRKFVVEVPYGNH